MEPAEQQEEARPRAPRTGGPPQLEVASGAPAERHRRVAARTTPSAHPSRRPRPPTRVVKPILFLLALLPLAYIVWAVVTDPDQLGANPINEVEHFTGRWALRFLALTLAITPLRKLLHVGELAKYRRMLGLFAFFYATVHLTTWVAVDMELDTGDMWHDVVKHKYITIGMAAWLMLLPLAITSTKGWIRRLGGRRWQRLHRLAYLAASAAIVHFVWAVKKDITEPLLYGAIIAALLGYRAWVALGERTPTER